MMIDKSELVKQIKMYDEVVNRLQDEIQEKIDKEGYLTRDDVKLMFDAARKEVKERDLMEGYDWGRCFAIQNAKISSLPCLHIAKDYTETTILAFHFPECDIVQRTVIEGFA